MVWDGEARTLNEAFQLLEQREEARDQWYCIRGPPAPHFLAASDFVWETHGPELFANSRKEVELCYNSCKNNETAVKHLLAAGADVHFRLAGFYNWTALHFAAAAGFPGIVDLLAGAGADVNARDVRGQHALFVAAAAGGNYYARIPDNLSRLLSPAVPWKESGERVTHVPTKRGDWRTEGSLAVARRLVGHGVDVWARDDAGCTADQVAALSGRDETRDFLRRLMGKDKEKGTDAGGAVARLVEEEEAAAREGLAAVTPDDSGRPMHLRWMAFELQLKQNVYEGDEFATLVTPFQVEALAAKQDEEDEAHAAAAEAQREQRELLWGNGGWAPVLKAAEEEEEEEAAAAAEAEEEARKKREGIKNVKNSGGGGSCAPRAEEKALCGRKEGFWNLEIHNRVIRRMQAAEDAGTLVHHADGTLEDRGLELPPLPRELTDNLEDLVEDLLS